MISGVSLVFLFFFLFPFFPALVGYIFPGTSDAGMIRSEILILLALPWKLILISFLLLFALSIAGLYHRRVILRLIAPLFQFLYTS